MERFSHSKHGVWVRHKETGEEGRIGYFDRKTRLYWVVWDPAFSNRKTYGASGVPARKLIRLRYEAEPWYDNLTPDSSYA